MVAGEEVEVAGEEVEVEEEERKKERKKERKSILLLPEKYAPANMMNIL